MKAIATAICVAFLSLAILVEGVAASSLRSRSDLISHHSSLARRSALTKRAARCQTTAKKPSTNASVTTFNSTIRSTWLCNGKPSGASGTISATGGPNGLQSWLMCGIDGSGWTPPKVTADQLVVVDLATALQSKSSPFHACSKYLTLFEKYANLHNLPPILLSSFSMQESGCNPAIVGGAGEVGLMQITPEKCKGAPNGNCHDPDFNIRTAAAYFAQSLQDSDNNIVLAVGRYNGYHPGLTHAEATAAAHTNCCRCQNNLDYLQQFFNGWLLNVNPYTLKLGYIFNLKVCPKNT